jgi:hypothetical protein
MHSSSLTDMKTHFKSPQSKIDTTQPRFTVEAFSEKHPHPEEYLIFSSLGSNAPVSKPASVTGSIDSKNEFKKIRDFTHRQLYKFRKTIQSFTQIGKTVQVQLHNGSHWEINRETQQCVKKPLEQEEA